MDRRSRSWLALFAIVVVATAGCSSNPFGDGSTGTTQGLAATEPGTPPRGTVAPTEAGPHTVPADDRLVLVKVIEENVTLSMYPDATTPIPSNTSAESAREEAGASVTYGPEQRGEMTVTAFEVDGYVVVSLDDRVIWQGQVEPYEHVKLYIDRDGDVEVSEHFVV